MKSGSISKRYARALIELAHTQGEVDTVLRELEEFVVTLRGSDALAAVMTTPTFSGWQRVAVLKELVETWKCSDLTRKFLLLVAEKDRLDILDFILIEYRNIYDEMNDLVRVSVTSAVPLSSEFEGEIVSHVGSIMGKKVVLSKKVDPSIIGGLVTRVGGTVIDGSLSTQLTDLKTELLREQLS